MWEANTFQRSTPFKDQRLLMQNIQQSKIKQFIIDGDWFSSFKGWAVLAWFTSKQTWNYFSYWSCIRHFGRQVISELVSTDAENVEILYQRLYKVLLIVLSSDQFNTLNRILLKLLMPLTTASVSIPMTFLRVMWTTPPSPQEWDTSTRPGMIPNLMMMYACQDFLIWLCLTFLIGWV